MPTYVIDAPGGGGKIPIMPNYIVSQGLNKFVVRNFEGVIASYQEPTHYEKETASVMSVVGKEKKNFRALPGFLRK